ncbi:hypothetical protein E2C01_013667 [Portunus trituberculatus]|uniref:Uncharacterized protein n=1 Tax=Portunus trituberculatus TaxID=210409 RepID=A0A5B7DGV8_PORTR|nr:hypothetical protein [Portunus trituberculatus]
MVEGRVRMGGGAGRGQGQGARLPGCQGRRDDRMARCKLTSKRMRTTLNSGFVSVFAHFSAPRHTAQQEAQHSLAATGNTINSSGKHMRLEI